VEVCGCKAAGVTVYPETVSGLTTPPPPLLMPKESPSAVVFAALRLAALIVKNCGGKSIGSLQIFSLI
jgi:hypothetical protein